MQERPVEECRCRMGGHGADCNVLLSPRSCESLDSTWSALALEVAIALRIESTSLSLSCTVSPGELWTS